MRDACTLLRNTVLMYLILLHARRCGMHFAVLYSVHTVVQYVLELMETIRNHHETTAGAAALKSVAVSIAVKIVLTLPIVQVFQQCVKLLSQLEAESPRPRNKNNHT